jgi:hypothetical protein
MQDKDQKTGHRPIPDNGRKRATSALTGNGRKTRVIGTEGKRPEITGHRPKKQRIQNELLTF